MGPLNAQRRARELGRFITESRAGGRELLRAAADELAAILDTPETLAYGIEARGDRLRLAFAESSFPGAMAVRRPLAELVAQASPGLVKYDLRRPEPWQRNVPMTRAMLDRRLSAPRPSKIIQLGASHGFSTADQLRVLICDGPALMAWFGATRDRRFTEREVRLLGLIARPLRVRLTLERRLGLVQVAWSAMEAALGVTPAPAVLVRVPGSVEHANTAAAALLAADRAAFLAGLREAVAGRGDGSWLLTRLDVSGPAYFLAVRRVAPTDPGPRAAAAARRLQLSPRQTQTLACLAQGQANASIAARFGCSETAVEMHVTALLRKFGVHNRAELVARFWTGLG